jgi:phosphoribosylformimino-5-aminoimidazole carboxamide ribotide isomerase
MQIWPAIDLLGGKCVRLEQGDYRRETVFADDPAGVAADFQRQGAEHLHLVDLDGARAGRPMNLDAVRAILDAVDMQCELGGGIRDEATIESLLETGLARLVLGTSALKRPAWFREMCGKFPNRLALGVDARHGMVATDGWLETSSTSAVDLVQQFTEAPLAAIIYTDIATDGMLQGPNVAAMRQMQESIDLPVIASGGVTTASDVAALAAAGLAGAIVGKALYVGTLTLNDALAAARQGAARAPT